MLSAMDWSTCLRPAIRQLTELPLDQSVAVAESIFGEQP
jgi:hypothetical protein